MGSVAFSVCAPRLSCFFSFPRCSLFVSLSLLNFAFSSSSRLSLSLSSFSLSRLLDIFFSLSLPCVPEGASFFAAAATAGARAPLKTIERYAFFKVRRVGAPVPGA